jgi:hypothetical protein
MGDVRLACVAPAFRFEIILALRLLISDQNENMEIVRANQREFVDRWYDSFAPVRGTIDTAMRPGSYMLCQALLPAGDSLMGVQACLRDFLEKGRFDAVDIEPAQMAEWQHAAAALGEVLPDFHEQCFREEWQRWEPALAEAGYRIREVLDGSDVFAFVEEFTGRDYGALDASLHPSEFVRPSAFVLHRGSRMAIVGQHQVDEIWQLAAVVHESGHRLFRIPDWHATGSLTAEDMEWVESLLPPDWQDTGYSEIRHYFEETFLEALAFSVVGHLLPDQRERVRERAMGNFRDRQLVLGPGLYEATETEYDPEAFRRYDDFVASLVRSRRLSVAPES